MVSFYNSGSVVVIYIILALLYLGSTQGGRMGIHYYEVQDRAGSDKQMSCSPGSASAQATQTGGLGLQFRFRAPVFSTTVPGTGWGRTKDWPR